MVHERDGECGKGRPGHGDEESARLDQAAGAAEYGLNVLCMIDDIDFMGDIF